MGAVEPFRQDGGPLECGAHGLADDLEGEPFGQRIDGLDALERLELLKRADMVRMGDLEPIAEPLEPAADHALSARWQCLLEVFRPAVKEHQIKEPGLVPTAH